MTWRERLRVTLRDYFGPWSSRDPALSRIFGYGPTKSGVSVTEESSLNISAVWACVQLIAGNLASLPVFHYKRLPNGDRERATETKLYRLLHDEPNDDMSAAVFYETLQQHVLLWGNGYAEIRRDKAGRVFDLYPIEPWRVVPQRRENGDLYYSVTNGTGMREMQPEEIVHVSGLSPNGISGYSVISKARESFGLTLAQEQFGASFFGKGSTFGGILTHPSNLTREAEDRLRASLELRHQGVERAHQFVILQGGMTYTPLGIPADDAQFLQQRQFQTAEIARWFGVPPHMIGDVERSTSWGAGIEAQKIGFLEFTLRRWLVKWERELNRKLISPLERNLQFIEFSVDGLERGDLDSRRNFYATAIQWGWMTRNEVRARENLPRLVDGDDPLVPTNMTTMELLTEPPAPAPVPPPRDDDVDAETDDDDNRQRLLAIEAAVLALPPAVPLDPVLTRLADVEAAIDKHAALVRELPTPRDDEKSDDFLARCMASGLMQSEFPDASQRMAVCQKQLSHRTVMLDLELLRDDTRCFRDDVVRHMEDERAAVTSRVDELGAILETARADEAAKRDEDAARVQGVAADVAVVHAELGAIQQRLDAAFAAVDLAEQRARVARPARALIEQVVRDIVRRERDRVVRAATAPDKLATWAERFYAQQPDYAVSKLRAVVELYAAAMGRPVDDVGAVIRERVGPIVEESRAALVAIAATPSDDVGAAVDTLVRRWEVERPSLLADALTMEIDRHA